MAQKSGRLTISSQGNSILNGTRLAIRGAGNPLVAATNFIRSSGFGQNSLITATGDDGLLGNISVFFITNITTAVRQPASPFGLESADELSEQVADSNVLPDKRNENILDKNDLRRRKRREKQVIIGIAGGATLFAVIALLLLSRKNSDNAQKTIKIRGV